MGISFGVSTILIFTYIASVVPFTLAEIDHRQKQRAAQSGIQTRSPGTTGRSWRVSLERRLRKLSENAYKMSKSKSTEIF